MGVIFSPRPNINPRGRACKEKINSLFFRNTLTVPKFVAQCRKRVNPYLYRLRRTIAYAYTLPNAIAYLNTCIPYLSTCITYLNTLNRLLVLGSIYDTLKRHDSSQQPIRIEHPRTLGSRQPIRINYYVTRFVSQSESSITSPKRPESSRLRRKTLLGSRLFSALLGSL